MKVVALRVLGAHLGLQSAKLFTPDIHDSLLDLQRPADEQQRRRRDEECLPLESLWCYYDIHSPRLVFQREKDEPFRCSGTLPADHEPGAGDVLAVLPFGDQLARRPHAVRHEQWTQM